MFDEIINTKINEYYVPYQDVFGYDGLVAYAGVVYNTKDNGFLEVEYGVLISRLNLRYFKKVNKNHIGLKDKEVIKRNYAIITIDV